ncbi:MAG: nucleoside triphosphate pyrophosphohydrolase [Blastocatellia bacterium]
MRNEFEELIEVMRRLRAPGGCPWDREQTHVSLAPYLLEEAYETFDAIHESAATGNYEPLKEELGDLLLQIIFHSEIAEERGDFNVGQIASDITQKLIRRHPHVFGDTRMENARAVLDNWDTLKANERLASGKPQPARESLLDDVPVHFPALLEALKLGKKAAKVGFDWKRPEDILEKASEEIGELRDAIEQGEPAKIEEEIGDFLFAVANLARHLEIEPETALKRTNRKFRKRFKFIEERLRSTGVSFESASADEMEQLWNEAKRHDA